MQAYDVVHHHLKQEEAISNHNVMQAYDVVYTHNHTVTYYNYSSHLQNSHIETHIKKDTNAILYPIILSSHLNLKHLLFDCMIWIFSNAS